MWNIILLGVLVSCKSKKHYVTLTGEKIDISSIPYIIAPNVKSRNRFNDSIFYLYPISPDSSQLEIRILKSHDDPDYNVYKSLFVLRQDKNGKWSKLAAVSKISDSKLVDSLGMLRVIPQNVALNINDRGLNAVGDSMLSWNIVNLKDFRDIDNYNSSTDADNVVVECVYNGKSRRFNLNYIKGNLDIPDVKALSRALNYIERDLGFKNFARK